MTQLTMQVLPFRKVIGTSCVSQSRDNLPLVDLLISLRERLLDIMSGSDRSQVLNLVTVPNVDLIDGDPAAEFSGILHEILSNVQILPEKNTLHLSSIFKWFATDFGRREGIIDLVLSHLSDTPQRTWLMQQRGRVSLRYKPFDWSLNSKAQTESVPSSTQGRQ
jgi:hypothetical protein